MAKIHFAPTQREPKCDSHSLDTLGHLLKISGKNPLKLNGDNCCGNFKNPESDLKRENYWSDDHVVFAPLEIVTLTGSKIATDERIELGSDVASEYRKRLQKRAISKDYTLVFLEFLMQIDSPLNYEKSIDCASTITLMNGKVVSKYCKQRWCRVCQRIYMAKMMNHWWHVFDEMVEPVFITLTRPSVTAKYLKSTIDKMIEDFRCINSSMRALKNPLELNGLRKLESNYNVEKQTFNPHFHVLIDGFLIGEELKRRWLVKNIPKGATKKAQNIKFADKDTGLEMFKYMTKLVSSDDNFHPQMLDTVYQAMRNRRIIQSIGNVRKAEYQHDAIDENFVNWLPLGIDEFHFDKVGKNPDWWNRDKVGLSGAKLSSKQILIQQKITKSGHESK